MFLINRLKKVQSFISFVRSHITWWNNFVAVGIKATGKKKIQIRGPLCETRQGDWLQKYQFGPILSPSKERDRETGNKLSLSVPTNKRGPNRSGDARDVAVFTGWSGRAHLET